MGAWGYDEDEVYISPPPFHNNCIDAITSQNQAAKAQKRKPTVL